MKRKKKVADFFTDHEREIYEFGEYVIGLLADRGLTDALAEKDLEKLARVFKLVFDKFCEGGAESEHPLLLEILKDAGCADERRSSD